MIALKFLIGLIVLIFLVTFAVKNLEEVTLYYYFEYQLGPVPLFFVLLASLFLGAGMIWVIATLEQMRLRMTVRKQARQIKYYEQEIQNFKVKDIVGDPVPPQSEDTPEEGSSPESVDQRNEISNP